MESKSVALNSDKIQVMDRVTAKESITKREKYMTTIVLMYTHFAFGIFCSQGITCTLDLKYIYGVTLAVLTITKITGMVGYFIGACSGFSYKYLNRQLVLIGILTIICIAKALTPHYPNIYFLYFGVLLEGIGIGAWDTAQNVWFLELWSGKYANTIMQVNQFFWGIGSMLGALIDRPYVIGDRPEDENKTLSIVLEDFPNFDATGEERRELLTKPYAFSAAIEMIAAISLLIFYWVKPYKHQPGNNINQLTNKKKIKLLDYPMFSRIRFLVIILTALVIGFFVGLLQAPYLSFSPIFAQKIPLHITASDSALILSVFSGVLTLSRGLEAFTALKVSPRIMISYHLVVVGIAIIILFFSFHSRTILWIANVVLGFGFSICLPAIYSYSEQFFDITDSIGAILVASSGAMSACVPLILGNMIEKTPQVMLYINTLGIILVVILFTLINIVVHYAKKRSYNQVIL